MNLIYLYISKQRSNEQNYCLKKICLLITANGMMNEIMNLMTFQTFSVSPISAC